MKEIQALDEGICAAEGADQRLHVAGGEEGVEPDGALIGLAAAGVEIAPCEVEEGTAEDRVLVAPCAVCVARLEEADEARVGAVDGRGLVCFEHVVEVAGAAEVLVVVCGVAEGEGEGGDDEVVVGVFGCAGDGAGFCAHAVQVEVFGWDVAEFFPGFESAAAFGVSVCGCIWEVLKIPSTSQLGGSSSASETSAS